MPLRIKWSPDDRTWLITANGDILLSFSDKQQAEDYLDKADEYMKDFCPYCGDPLSAIGEEICADCAGDLFSDDDDLDNEYE